MRTNESVMPPLQAQLARQRGVAHLRRIGHQALHAAQALGQRDEAQRREEAPRAGLVGAQWTADSNGSGPRYLRARQRVLRVVGQTEKCTCSTCGC